jgi:FkbM family methyltransferase
MQKIVLPDGMAAFALNADEARFVYREVFKERCYLGHGVSLRDGDCVFDVGANIGLASLFFHLERRNIRLFAFEPNPVAYECLRANVELHGMNARVFACGLSSRSGSAEFTLYPQNTVMSGFHADQEKDRQASRTYMVNSGTPQRIADRLVGLLFRKQTLTCPLRTLSEIIDEEQVSCIDLLKVDVERSEKEVLEGIRDEHWGMVRQVAIEVHDEDDRLRELQNLLTQRGFRFVVEQDPAMRGSALFNLFGSR